MSRPKKKGRKPLPHKQLRKNINARSQAWVKANTVSLNLRLIKSKDSDIIEYLATLSIPKSDYIKQLIRDDIKKR